MSKTKDNLVLIKKILNFHSDKPGKYPNIEHTVKLTDLIPVTFKSNGDLNDMDVLQKVKNYEIKLYTFKQNSFIKKTQKITYMYDTSDDESEEENKDETDVVDNVPDANLEVSANNEPGINTLDSDDAQSLNNGNLGAI